MPATAQQNYRDLTHATPEEIEEDRRQLMEPMSEERRQQWFEVLARIDAHNQEMLERRGGVPIPDEEIQAALDEARDH